MANIKSQIKRNRQNDKRRLRNRVYRGTARIAVKNARTAIDSGVPESKAALASAISALDKAAEKGVIHRNNAARRKSRLVRAFARLEPVKTEAEPAMVEPVAEPEVKKAAPRRRAAKAEAESEAKAEDKTAPKAERKAAPRKTTATRSPKAKKEPATPRKPRAKKEE